jgi:hypothetical protein
LFGLGIDELIDGDAKGSEPHRLLGWLNDLADYFNQFIVYVGDPCSWEDDEDSTRNTWMREAHALLRSAKTPGVDTNFRWAYVELAHDPAGSHCLTDEIVGFDRFPILEPTVRYERFFLPLLGTVIVQGSRWAAQYYTGDGPVEFTNRPDSTHKPSLKPFASRKYGR